jgi:hypothetical protein
MSHGHHWAAFLSVGIGAFTAIAVSLWASISGQTRREDKPRGPKRR